MLACRVQRAHRASRPRRDRTNGSRRRFVGARACGRRASVALEWVRSPAAMRGPGRSVALDAVRCACGARPPFGRVRRPVAACQGAVQRDCAVAAGIPFDAGPPPPARDAGNDEPGWVAGKAKAAPPCGFAGVPARRGRVELAGRPRPRPPATLVEVAAYHVRGRGVFNRQFKATSLAIMLQNVRLKRLWVRTWVSCSRAIRVDAFAFGPLCLEPPACRGRVWCK